MKTVDLSRLIHSPVVRNTRRTESNVLDTASAVILHFVLLVLLAIFLKPIQVYGNVTKPTTLSSSSKADNRTTLLIGYLPIERTPSTIRLVERQYRIISGALTYAIDVINKNRTIPGHKLDYIWNDTEGTISGGLRAITDQWVRGVDVFMGPEETCNYEGRVAAAWNLPMLSYKCVDDEVSDKTNYPTFARTKPPAAQVSTSILSLLLHFNWTRFTLIVGSSQPQQSVAKKLRELAKQNNLTINHDKQFKEPHFPQIAGNPFPGLVQDTYLETRVYVFLGQRNAMVDMMTNMNDRGLLATGEYVNIFIDHRAQAGEDDPQRYFRRTFDPDDLNLFPQGKQSLLVVMPSAVARATAEIQDFHKRVRWYNENVFRFFDPPGVTKRITTYAAYLYDAISLYALAVADVLRGGGSTRNGTAIVNKIRGREYTSVLGYKTRIDMNGDAEGHFTLLALKHDPTQRENFTMAPVADFQMNASGDRPIFRMLPGEKILWMNGVPPEAEPACGYHRERCIPPKTYVREIVLGVLGGVLLVAAIILIVIIRNRRYEQEIDGLLWKIESSAIHMCHSCGGSGFPNNDKHAALDGGVVSIASAESRNSYTQVFAQTGTLKGQTVALKLFDKQKVDLSRKTKKEMKMLRDLRHNNVNSFIGASVDSDLFVLVTEYCSKGSLTDVLENEDMTLDGMFISSLVKDLLQGMIYLHDSEIQFHGNLKSSNCLITSRWTLQVGDYGLLDVRAMTYKPEDVFAYYRNLLWKAPELLRSSKPHRGSQKGDVYSFGIILYEMFGRAGPYGHCKLPPKEIIENVKSLEAAARTPFRPDTLWLTCEDYITSCMEECWSEYPEQRPDFKTIWHKLKPMRAGMKRNIFDNMMAMMEKYQERLEELVEERTLQLVEEKKKTETLLLRMLPKYVADQLKRGESVVPEAFDSVTIYFSDICGFTKLSAESTPMEVVDMLNDLYTTFDSIVRNYDVYKVETIGDAYMVVSGLPVRNGDLHAGEVASMSLALLKAIKSFKIRHRPEETLKLRIGIHSGPCVAGVVGLTMPRYTLFGDTVNTASRMETNGEPLKIHCSIECKYILEKLGGYTLEERGYVTMKGKGSVLTYWLTGENPDVRKQRLRKYNASLQPPALEDTTDSAYTPPLSTRQYLNTSSSHNSLTPLGHSPMSPSPNHSPMPSRPSKVRLAESAPTNSPGPLVYDLFRDSDSARGVSGEVINGLNPFRGRLHSFKDAFNQKRHKQLNVPNNSVSEPAIQGHVNPAHGTGVAVGHTPVRDCNSNPMEQLDQGQGQGHGDLPRDKGYLEVIGDKVQRRDNSHCVSIYDNACPTELSVLLDELGGNDSFEEMDRDGIEAETKFCLDFASD